MISCVLLPPSTGCIDSAAPRVAGRGIGISTVRKHAGQESAEWGSGQGRGGLDTHTHTHTQLPPLSASSSPSTSLCVLTPTAAHSQLPSTPLRPVRDKDGRPPLQHTLTHTHAHTSSRVLGAEGGTLRMEIGCVDERERERERKRKRKRTGRGNVHGGKRRGNVCGSASEGSHGHDGASAKVVLTLGMRVTLKQAGEGGGGEGVGVITHRLAGGEFRVLFRGSGCVHVDVPSHSLLPL